MTQNPALASIQDAARILNVSTKTLRRWEARGVLVPIRTEGGHRRYDLNQIKELKGNRRRIRLSAATQATTVNPSPAIEVKDIPVLYQSLHIDQRKVLRFVTVTFAAALIMFTTVKLTPQGAIENFKTKVLGLKTSENINNPFFKPETEAGAVLAAETSSTQPKFNINIESAFKENTLFGKDVEIDGDLTLKKQIIGNVDLTGVIIVGGNSITSAQNTFNLLNTGTSTLNIGGAATAVSIGATTGTTNINNNLTVDGTAAITGATTIASTLGVTGKITGSGDLAITGNTTLTGTVSVGGKITGSGDLAISGNATFGNITSVNGVTYSFPSSQGGGDTFLKNNGSGTLTWATPSFSASSITGVLPIANGGTNNSTAYTAGSVIFSDGTKLTQDNSNFYFDDTNNRLGIGNNSPSVALDVTGAGTFSGDIAVNGGDITTTQTTANIFTNATTLGISSGTGTTTINNALTATGATNLNGNATFGDTTGDAITFTGRVNSNILPSVTLTDDLGSALLSWNNVYANSFIQNGNAVCDASGANCPAGSTQYWGLSSGALFPVTSSADVLIGANSTASAKFAFKNVLTGTPTASISGTTANVATYLDGNGNLSTTNAAALTLGSSTTGNVVINSRGSTALTANGANLTASGTVSLPNSNTLTGVSNYVQTSGGYSVGGGTTYYLDGSGNLNANAGTFAGNVAVNGGNLTTTQTTANLFTNATTLGIGAGSGTTTINNALAVTGATTLNGNITLGDAITDTLTFTGRVAQDADLLPIGTTGTNDLGSASLPWDNVYAVNLYQNGNAVCDASGANCPAGATQYWGQASGSLYSLNNTTDLLIGGSATASAKFAFVNVTTGTPTASISGSVANVSTYLDGNGNLSTTNAQNLTLGSSTTGNVAINSRGSTALTANGANLTAGGTFSLPNSNTLSGVINYVQSSTGYSVGGATTYYFDGSGNINANAGTFAGALTANGNTTLGDAITDTLTFTSRVAQDSDLLPIGTTGTNDLGSASLPWDNVYSNNFVQNGFNVCDASGANCPAAGSGGSKWKLGSGAISPFSDTLDVLIGNSATTSAKFAFKGVSSGTPTASISGTTTNVATYLDGEGNLSTTTMANLTLGSSTTGNVVLNSRGSNALTANGANLTTTGTFTLPNSNTLTGVSNYLQTSGGYSVGGGTTYYLDGSGNLNANAGTFAGALTANGNTTLGDAITDTITFTGRVAQDADLIPIGTTGTNDLGSASLPWDNVYATAFTQNGNTVCDSSGNCLASVNYWQLNNKVLSPGNSTYDLAIGGTATGSAFQVFGVEKAAGNIAKLNSTVVTTGNVIEATASAITSGNLVKLGTGGNNGNFTGNGIYMDFDNTGGNSFTGNFLKFDNAGSTQFTVGSTGVLTLSNGETIDNLTNGTVNIGTTTLKLTGGTDVVSDQASVNLFNATTTTLSLGGAATTLNIGPTGSGASSIVFSGGSSDTGCTLDGSTGNLTCSGDLAVNGGDLTTTQTTANLFTNASTLGIGAGSGTTTINNGLAVTGATTLNGNTTLGDGITDTITLTGRVAQDSDLLPIGTTGTNDLGSASLPWDNVYSNNFVQNGFGVCDSSGSNCPAAGSGGSKWKLVSGAISPFSDSLDVLIGNSATTSAKFAFKNVASGTPTASISGTTTNVATYLDGEGNLSTTNAAGLTLGSATTGNVVINSRGSSALTANGANLTAGGTITLPNTNTLSGVANYVQSSTGFSVGGATTYHFDSSGNIIANGVIANADVTLGDTSADSITILGRVAQDSDIVPITTTGTSDLGGASLPWDNVYAVTLTQNGNTVCDSSGNCLTSASYFQLNNKILSPGNSTYDLAIGGTATGSAFQVFGIEKAAGNIAKINSTVVTTGNVIEATASAITSGNLVKLGSGGNNGNFTGNGIYMDFDNTGGNSFTGNFLKFDNAGSTQFTVGSTGVLTLSNSETIDNLTNGTVNIGTTTLKLTGGTDVVSDQTSVNLFNATTTTLSLGGAATTLNIGPTGSGASSIVFSGGSGDTGCTLNGATGDLTCSGDLAVNGGDLTTTQTTANLFTNATTLGLGAGSGTTTINNALAVTGNASLNGDTTIGNAITDNITFTGRVAQDADLLPIGTTGTNDLGSASLPWDNVYAVAFTQNGNAVCDSSGANCPAAGSGGSKWKLLSGAISPFSDTLDVLIGNSATTSAKFAFKNVASGTPTASISGTTANVATYIDGNGNMATTNRANLVLGNSSTYDTTGNVLLNPNGTGNVGIGVSAPKGTLDVGGTATISGTLTLGNGTTNTLRSPYGPLNLAYKSAAATWTNGITLTDTTGDVIIAQDLAVNGGDLTTSQTTATLFNTTATTLSLGGAATTLNIGPTGSGASSIVLSGGSGDTGCTIDGSTGNLTCSGDLAVNGGDLTTTQTTANLFTNATTLGIGNVAGISTINGTLSVTGATTLNGNTTIGDAITDNITFTGRVAQDADLIPIGTTGTNDLGSASLPWDNVYAVAFNQNGNSVCDSSGNCAGVSSMWQLNNKVISPAISSYDLVVGGTATGSAFQVYGIENSSGGIVKINSTVIKNSSIFEATSSAITGGNFIKLGHGGNNGNFTGNGIFMDFDNSGGNSFTGNFLKFDNDGLTQFTVGSTGVITLKNSETIDNTTNGTVNIGTTTLKLTGGTDVVTDQTSLNLFNATTTTLSLGGAATTLNIGPTGSGASSIVLSGGSADTGCTLNGATGDLTCSGDIAVNGGDLTTTATTANLFTNATTLGLGAGSGTTTINNGLAVTGAAALNGNVTIGDAITDTITFTGRVAQDADLIPIGTTGTNDLGSASLPWDNVYGVAFTQNGNTVCDSSNNCSYALAANNYWQLNNKIVSPANSTYDLAIGGTATGSAYQVFGIEKATGNIEKLTSTVITTGNVIEATASAITSGNMIKLGSGGNNGNFTGNGIYMDFDNTGGSSFTGNFLKFDNAGSTKFTVGSTGVLTLANSETIDNTTDGTVNIGTTTFKLTGGTDVVTDQTSLNLFNATTTTLSLGGAATTALNLGNGSGNYTAINLGSGSGTHTINIAGTGATAADTVNIGTGGTGADTINIGSNASTTALNLTSGTGAQTFTSSVATGTLTSGAFVFKDAALSSGDMIYATAAGALSSGNLIKLGTGGNTTFTGNGLYMDLDNTGQGGLGFTGNFLKFDNAGSTKGTLSSAGLLTIADDAAVNGGDITTTSTTATLFNTNATTLSMGGAATTALNLGNGSGAYTAINLGSGSGTHTINIAGTGATSADTINIGTGGTAADTINIGSSASSTALNLTSGTGTQTFASSVATTTGTSGAFAFTANSLTTGTGMYINSSSITTGDLLSINATGTTLTSGYLLNVQNNSSSVFNVGASQITSALPHQFTAAGDVTMAYDLVFTNQTASTIDSYGPLTLRAGESFESNNLTLKTYNSGNIIFDQDVNGKVLIGTGSATLKFTVSDAQAATAAAMIENTYNGTDADGLAIKLGFTGSGNAANRFITFMNGVGTIQGKIRSAGTTVSYDTGGIDMAEYFTKENGFNPEPGDVIAISASSQKVKATDASYDPRVIGVISEAPGFTGGLDGPDKALVALVGQVKIKIDPSSPAIAAGDYLTSSPITGRAMKSTKAGAVVAKALEAWTPGSGTDKIMGYINVSYHDPNAYLTSNGNMGGINLAEDTNNPGYSKLVDGNGNNIEKLSGFTGIITNAFNAIQGTVDNLLVKVGLVSPEVLTRDIKPLAGEKNINITLGNATESGKLTVRDNSGATVASIDSTGDATFSGQINAENASVSGALYASTIYADQIISKDGKFGDVSTNTLGGISREQIENLLKSIEEDQVLAAQSQNWSSQTATSSASINELNLKDLYVTGIAAFDSINVQNNVVFAGELAISKLTNGPSSLITLDTIDSPLSIQSGAAQPLYIMAGKVKVDVDGNVQVLGNLAVGGVLSASAVSIAEDPNASVSATVDGDVLNSLATAGEGRVASGSSEIKIVNPNIKEGSLIFVTPTSQVNEALFVKSKENGSAIIGFTNQATSEVKFNWWIVNLVNGQTQ